MAVVGGFKGALHQAAVYPATIMGEAVRVPGAAFIWFSHNHPSGESKLSRADESLNRQMADVFLGSGIRPMGLLAVAGGKFTHVDSSGSNISTGAIPSDRGSVAVPAIERELHSPLDSARPAVESPQQAKDQAVDHYTLAKAPGLLLLDGQHRVAAWVPLPLDFDDARHRRSQ